MSWRPELGSGPLSADLHLIGRDFGAEEARAGQPFQGQAGQLLNQSLRFAGIDRAAIRVDNLVPTQPPANDFARHAPGIVEWGKARLTALLEGAKPKLIVALGNEVASFLLAEACPADGIQAFRGYLWDTRFGRVLTTVHPAGVLRDWTPWRALLNLDLRRAAAELAAGCPALDQREVTIVTSPRDVEELRDAIRGRAGAVAGESERPVRRVVGLAENKRHRTSTYRYEHTDGAYNERRLPELQESYSGLGWLAVDIENHADLTLACVGFAPSAQRAWVIPAHEPWQLAAIRELCESDVPKVLQNGQYDRFFLRRFCDINLRAQAFDTQLAWHCLQPELAGKKLHTTARKKTYSRTTVKSLKFLSSIYTRDPWWKEYSFMNDDERYILCGKDVCVTLDIATKQAKQLEAA